MRKRETDREADREQERRWGAQKRQRKAHRNLASITYLVSTYIFKKKHVGETE